MKTPFFTIVVTVYNKEKYIKQCIQSVLNQTCDDFELIVIDDCSQDNSIKIVEEFDDKRIKIIKNIKNEGVSSSRNTALKFAQGKYIYFVDCDDELRQTLLLEAKKELLKDEASVLIFPYNIYFEQKKRLKTISSKLNISQIKKLKKPFSFKTAKLQLLRCNYEVWNKIFSVEFLLNNNITFNDKLFFCEDFEFYSKVLKAMPNFTYLKKVGYVYHVQKREYRPDDILRQFEIAFDTIVKNLEEMYDKNVLDNYFAYILNYWLMKVNYDKNIYEFACRICPKKLIVEPDLTSAKLKYYLFYTISSLL